MTATTDARALERWESEGGRVPEPIGEPIAWQGPIVTNTPEELRLTFEKSERNTFVKDRE